MKFARKFPAASTIAWLLLSTGLIDAQETDRRKEFPKPIFTVDARLLAGNSFIQRHQNMTSAWIHDRVNGKYDTSYVSLDRVDAFIKSDYGKQTSILTIDIEAFQISRYTDPKWGFWMSEYTKVAKRLEQGMPDRQKGYYQHSNYHAPVGYKNWVIDKWGHPSRTKKFAHHMEYWRKSNDAIAEQYRPIVDFVSIGLYNPYPKRPRDWRAFASANLKEMKRCYPDKPVFAWIQANYTANSFSPIPLDEWEMMVTFLMDNPDCDGIFIFTLKKFRGRPVRREEGWRQIFLPDSGSGDR